MKDDFNYIVNLFAKENKCKEFKQQDIEEIRIIRVLSGYKLKYLQNRSACRLLFFSNDDLYFINKNTPEDRLMFYSIKISSTYHIFGIHIIYYENRTREETIIYNREISKFLYFLLISKYNSKYSPLNL